MPASNCLVVCFVFFVCFGACVRGMSKLNDFTAQVMAGLA